MAIQTHVLPESVDLVFEGYLSYDADILVFLHKGIQAIEAGAFVCLNREARISFCFDGTIAEWKAIRKGSFREEEREDWYGYYYHNAPRFETVRVYDSWAKGSKGPYEVQCSDGPFLDNEEDDKANAPLKK